MGVATGMIWNRRDILMAPSVFALLFIGATWGAGKPESLAELMELIHENAKLLRYGISQTLKTIHQGWETLCVIFVLGTTITVVWKLRRWLPLIWLTRDETDRLREPVVASPATQVRAATVEEVGVEQKGGGARKGCGGSHPS